MKRIPVGPRHYAMVDDRDYEYLSQFTWSYLRGGYAFRRTSKKLGPIRTIYMHREIMQTPEDMDTDHINGNGLDNRRANLRVCTTAENLANRTRLISRNTSGYKGVTWDGKYWVAQIGYQRDGYRTNTILGRFQSAEDAARAYDRASIERYGEFARLNLAMGG